MTNFAGFGPDFLVFFRDLGANQNREWFQANKTNYDAAVRDPMREMVIALNAALAERDLPLSGDPKRSITRINRDVRFSADKSPYKTYVAATFTRDPGEMSPGLLYLQLSPEESFAGLGFYAVEPTDLTAFRTAIIERSAEWGEVTAALDRNGHPLEQGEALKRMPKGFEAHAAEPFAGDLRLKAHVCKLRLGPGDLGPELTERIVDFTARCRPLLDFGWRALEP